MCHSKTCPPILPAAAPIRTGTVNVTIPHKEAIGVLIDAPDAKALAIGAVNTVVPLPGGGLGGDQY